MVMSGQIEEEVQGKEVDGQKEDEGEGGIDGASWSAGACTRRGAGRRVPVDFMILSILSQIYYNIWDWYPKIINVFGLNFMITWICVTNKLYYLGLISQNY